MMQRRGFLGAILAAGFAPAFVGSSVLMPVRKIVPAAPVGRFTSAEKEALDKVLADLDDVQWRLPRQTTITVAHGMMIGDVFTIAGIPGRYRVQSVDRGIVSILVT